MSKCEFCPEPVDADDPETYHQVVSWVNGPKLDGPKLREQSGLLAHKRCIDHLVAGQAADQPELFEEFFDTDSGEEVYSQKPLLPPPSLLTDEPGKIMKLTGPDSIHQAIQEHIRTRALALQAEGPDEYPYGYYEDLARTQFEERMERKRRDQS